MAPEHASRACKRFARLTPNARSQGDVTFDTCQLDGIRRHLTASQRAAVAALLWPAEKAKAKKRSGTRTDLQAKLPGGDKGLSRDAAGKKAGVSGRYVSDAKRAEG